MELHGIGVRHQFLRFLGVRHQLQILQTTWQILQLVCSWGQAPVLARFDCRLRRVQPRPAFEARPLSGLETFVTRGPRPQNERREAASAERRTEVEIDGTTGLVARYAVDGVDYLRSGACRAMVMKDDADPWGLKVRAFRDVAGSFRLMSPRRAALVAGVARQKLPPVRVIEQGPVRTIVEALFEHGDSTLCLRYVLPACGSEVEIEARLYWLEKDRLVKVSFPTPFTGGMVQGQAAYGVERYGSEREESVARQWWPSPPRTASMR